ncbi:MAG: hypothetical protein WC627_01480, partial [Legionella sp.]
MQHGLGTKRDSLKQTEVVYGQAQISINANVLTGNLFVKDFAQTFVEQGFQFNIGYQFNSQSSSPWRLNQGKIIGSIQGQPNTIDSYIRVEESDGQESTYTYNVERGSYVNLSEAGGASVLTYNPDGHWVGWNPLTNIKETYNQKNQIKTRTDISGSQLSYNYDASGRLIAISGNSGPKVKIEYTPQQTSIYTINGNIKTLVSQYLFDGANRLIKTTVPIIADDNYEINYAYSDSGQLESITQSDQTVANFEYDLLSDLYHVNKLRDGSGNTSELIYYDESTKVLDALDNEQLFGINDSGLLKSYTHNEQFNEYFYDEANRIEKIQYQDETVQEYSYDALGCYSKISRRSGEQTLFNRDAITGLLLSETKVIDNDDSEQQLNTFYIYNDKRELIYKIMPNGAVTAFAYDDKGNCNKQKIYLETVFNINRLDKDSVVSLSAVTDWCTKQNQQAVALTEWTHTAYGEKSSQRTYATIASDGSGIRDNFCSYEEYTWNLFGDLLTHKTKLNAQEEAIKSVEYDGLSRKVQEVNPLGQILTHKYQDNKHISIFAPTGLITTTSWDAGGDVTDKQEQAGECISNTKLIYDSAGRVSTIEKINDSKEYLVHDRYNRVQFRIDSEGRVVENKYDINNQLTHCLRYPEPISFIDEDQLYSAKWLPTLEGTPCIESSIYDASGRLLCTLDGDNYVKKYFYNSIGNHVKTIEYAIPLDCTEIQRLDLEYPPEVEQSTEDREHKYFYNEASHLIAYQNPYGQVITYKRNAQGDLLQKTTSLVALPAIVHWDEQLLTGVAQKSEAYVLDARGRCLQHTNAEHAIKTQVWDAGGRITQSSFGGEIQSCDWDVMNRLKKETSSNGLVIKKTYAPCGKIESIIKTDEISKSANPRAEHFRYDGFGQTTHELSPRASLKLSDPAFAADDTLVSSLWQNNSVHHVYDQAGLKISTKDELGNSTYFYYNRAKELRFTISPTGSITEYTYDVIFHKQNSMRNYALRLEESELTLLSGGMVTTDLLEEFHDKQSDEDAVETIRYNNRGLIDKQVDAELFEAHNVYDAWHNPTRTEHQIDDDNQLVCTMEYDNSNRLVSKIKDVGNINATETWDYLDENNEVIHTDANKNKKRTFHDKLDRKIKEINALGHETAYALDSLSRLTSSTDAMQNTTQYTYENHGRKIIKATPLAKTIIEKNAFDEIEIEENADGEIWKKINDVDGQLKTRIDPDNNMYQNKYNIAGWLTEVIDPLDKITRYEHTKSGQIKRQIEVGLNEERITKFKHNTQGREIQRTNANEMVTQTVYDKRGLIIDTIIDPSDLALSCRYEYDGLTNPIREIKGNTAYPDQLTKQFIYDNLSKLKSETLDPEGLALRTEIIRDPLGNCIENIDSNGHKSRTIYDAANQERFRIDPMGGVIGYILNKNGFCTEERHYSTPLNLAAISDFTCSHIEAVLNPSDADKVFIYVYDEDNKLVQSLNDYKKVSRYCYNAQGKKTLEYSYATPMTQTEFKQGLPAVSQQDRQTAWFYDGRGNERFTINGEGIVTEQIWNGKGWLLEKRVYMMPCFDYTKFPVRETLKHPEDRFERYIHDTFGRVVFEVNAEGYVVEYGYDKGDKPQYTWFYPDKIKLPSEFTINALRALLPVKDSIPYKQVIYDTASRKIEAIDELKYKELFKLDALGNLRELIDKGGDSWTFEVDGADRKIEEATPPVEVTSVTLQGQLIKPNGKQRIIKKIEYDGVIERIIEGYGTVEARTLEFHRNPCNQIEKTVQYGVYVNDKTKKPSRINDEDYAPVNKKRTEAATKKNPNLHQRLETLETLTTVNIHNAFQKPIVQFDEAGNPQFSIYEGDKLRYRIDEEGYVTAFEYNVFKNIIKATRFDTAISLDLRAFSATGIPLSKVVEAIKTSNNDRSVIMEFDRINRQTTIIQDSIFVYIPQNAGPALYGECSPTKINEYNAFGEIHTMRELVDPFNQKWDVVRKWSNLSGHVIAEVNGLNYLTLFTRDGFGNDVKVIEYARKLKGFIDRETSLSEILSQLDFDTEYDRIYTNKYNARQELVATIQEKVRLYDPELDISNINIPDLSGIKNVEDRFGYNAKGFPVRKESSHGAIIITEYDARNLPILKTKPLRKLESGTATPVTTTGYNAFAQPTRVTHHNNPYEQKAYLKESNEDQIHLTGYDSRGLQVIAINPERAVHSQSFNETKKLVSSWIWISGWGANAALTQRLNQTLYEYDKRGMETQSSRSIETGSTVVTATRYNAFGEKVAQGSGDGTYPIYWLRDKTGMVWHTNEQSGVPTIVLSDAHGQETATLHSRTHSLQGVQTVNALKSIIDLDYRELQRLELLRDVRGGIEAQHLPAFSSIKLDAPEPHLTAVTTGTSYPELGLISLSWPVPDIAGLKPEVLIYPKGSVAEAKPIIDVPIINGRYGIDVSEFTTDEYHYQIDFYYQDPLSNQRESSPRYRTDGDVFIITEYFTPNQKNLVWRQIDDQRLMFYGNLGDVTGIELIQKDKSLGRVPLTNTEKPNCWMIDLSEKPSGHYKFRCIHGFSLLEEQPIKIGTPSAKGIRLDRITTNFKQDLHLYPLKLDMDVTSSWDNLPPQVNNLYQELIVIKGKQTKNQDSKAYPDYATETKIVDLKTNKSGSSTATFHNDFKIPILSFTQFSTTISRNRLFAVDSNNKQWTVAEIVNPLAGNNTINPDFLYLHAAADLPQVDALRERHSNGDFGKMIGLKQWINNSLRCAGSFFDNSTSYELVSLNSSTPDALMCGEVTIHTANTQSKQLLVKEIALTKPRVSKIKTEYNRPEDYYCQRDGINFKWILPDYLSNNLVKVNFQLHFKDEIFTRVYGDRCNFEYILGKSHHTPYNGHLLLLDPTLNHLPDFSYFNLAHLSMYVQYNEDWIPLINTSSFTTDRTKDTKNFSTSMKVSEDILGKKISYTASSTKYIEGDVAIFEDSYTLVFYPVPSDIDENSISLEFWDLSLPIPVWRPLTDAQYTGHAIFVPANSIQPGVYQYRLKAKNKNAENINFTDLVDQVQDGWALGSFKVTHGNQLTSINRTMPDREVLRPVRKQEIDRWGNVVSTTNTLGDTVLVNYNAKNKPLKTTQPKIVSTDENGSKKTVAPKSYTIYDLNEKVVTLVDANGHMTYHERDLDGTTLKTTLADGSFKQFILDIFGRTLKIRDPFDKDTINQFNKCNREVVRIDANEWKTGFSYNELGERLSTTNGNIETERFDYLHPSRNVTHHYLPEGDAYLTINDYDHNGILIKEELPDHRKNTWEVDAFGNIRSHTDLGGAVYTYTLNEFYPTELLQLKSENGQHGDRMSMDGTTKPMSNQDLVHQYDEASHLQTILDNALALTTVYRLDIEGRRARETFIASDGHIHQAVLMKWNALGWIDEVQDAIMQVKYGYDPKGNRRSTLASVYMDGDWCLSEEENWYTYTASDSIAINRGILKNGKIQIASKHGTKLIYDEAGRRRYEHTINSQGNDVLKTLFYHPNNLLKYTQSSINGIADYEYDGKVARRKVYATKNTKQEYVYSHNGWLTVERFTNDDKKFKTKTKYDLNLLGYPEQQTTTVYNLDGDYIYEDKIKTEYVQFDTDRVSLISGTRYPKEGDKTLSTTRSSYDPNGTIETIVGKEQEPRHFITNSNNRIIQKSLGKDKKEFYFYTTSDQPLGRFGNIPQESLKKEVTNIDFDLNYHPVSEHFPPPTPSVCKVMPGDTFSSISERMYGDESFANLISDVNGFRKDELPPVGLTQLIPNIVNTNLHNWQGHYPLYNPSAIIGSLYPHMPMPKQKIQKRKQPPFWHVLVEAIVSAAILAFAPEFAAAFSGVLGQLLGEALGFALAGAASNLMQQELALGFGDQKELSLTSIGQSALLSMGTAGIAKGLNMDLMRSPQYRNLFDQAIKNIELTIATQGLSFATGQQRHFDWRVLVASVSNAMANVGAGKMEFTNHFFNDALATASSSVASIGIYKMVGVDITSETIAANTLGTFIGNQLAAQAKQHYAEYQAKKYLEAEYQRSQIPEIGQELEASERRFIKSVVAHPH